MIRFEQKGDFKKLNSFLQKQLRRVHWSKLDEYGRLGVDALKNATPVETGKTANSWYYDIKTNGNRVAIEWKNRNVNDGIPVAVILQYGHGTGTGGWVEGRDYINPAIQPVFDKIAKELWKEITAV